MLVVCDQSTGAVTLPAEGQDCEGRDKGKRGKVAGYSCGCDCYLVLPNTEIHKNKNYGDR